MCWKTVRLELARAPNFPNGSASRAYLLHLPLDADGRLEEHELARSPALATVRRHWPNERDRAGNLMRTEQGWAIVYGREGEKLLGHELDQLRRGGDVTITEPDGSRTSYRVM